jgi:hypothetical protein
MQANDQALELLRGKLRAEMNDRADHIAGGSCEDIEEYRFQVGIVHGLAWAERELLDLDERLTAE